MNLKTLSAALLCLAAAPLHAEEARLFRMTAPAGYVFQELERKESSSTVEAIEPAGSAVAKSMFLLRASCGLMKERGQEAFWTERLSLQPLRFIVHFVAPGSPGHEAPDPAKGEEALVSAAWCDRVESIFALSHD